MYKLTTFPNQVIRTEDGATIPFDPANTDYEAFKKSVLEGAELFDSEGKAMTSAQAIAFVKELP